MTGKVTHKQTKEERLAKRNELIRADFKKMTTEQHLDSTYVVEVVLYNKYLPLETSTLWWIILRLGKYKTQ